MRKLYNYMGAKTKHLDLINSLIKSCKSRNYCEPFLGSSIVFLNLQKSFNHYFLNDLQEENLLAFNNNLNEFFIEYTFKECINKYPSKDKVMYYKFRDELLNNTPNSDKKKAIYIFRIYNECINNMARFNKSKFNQSFGDRVCTDKHLKDYIEAIKYIQTKDITVSNLDFENLLDKKNCLYFFDPPYLTNKMAISNNFNDVKLKKLVDFMESTEEEFIYTDTINDINKSLLEKFNYIEIEKIKNISPNRNKESNIKEVVIYNFNHVPNKFDFE